ncbi:hypothetical protein AQ490_23180 [Wenjunlia vitaminophila]|uniref:Minor tail protein n=1 Tax=Wenjunlia vitaminophila TaxID=76728 RepID=A0A0T6LS64_WENVI|nr:hypothetical protein [Wenjunlia vitaminophila]KRV48777.1 hypothetical protein AQ490_23180 [Wenjunlia vitaminophila]
MTALEDFRFPGQEEHADHTYTFLFCDLRTDAVLAELPMSQVTYGWELNGLGTLRGTVPFTDETLPLDPLAATAPARTCVYVDRDGELIWGGIIWTREIVPGGRAIQASEFLSYYQRRYVRQTLSTDTSQITNAAYVPAGQRLYADQRHIVWSLLRSVGDLIGDIEIDINPLRFATGVSRDVTYYGYDRPEIYASIKALSEAESGFDFGMEIGWKPTAGGEPKRYRRAQVWYPRRGRSAADSGLVFAKGGPASNLLDYGSLPEDGTAFATSVSALGAGDGEARLEAIQTADDLIAGGWPLLEAVERHESVVTADELADYARADLGARVKGQTSPTFVVSAEADPVLGSYTVGDSARFVVEPEPVLPTGYDRELRIVSMEVTASRGPERVRLTCVEG